MQTQLLSASKSKDIDLAGNLLLAGELVAVPTETVYGLAADATNSEAVAKIFAAKNRPADHPLITHIHSPDVLSKWAKNIPEWVPALVAKFWPGPLTLILERNDSVSEVITGGQDTIGLRMPNHPVLLDLLERHKLAVAAPSANPYQQLSPTSAEQVLAGLTGKIAAVLDGGRCRVGTESTILAVTESSATILRRGPLTLADIQPFVPVTINEPEINTRAVSGNKEIHYQPTTPLYLKTAAEFRQLASQQNRKIGALVYSTSEQEVNIPHMKTMSSQHEEYRRELYAALFELDKIGVQEIWVEIPPANVLWLDIHDRLNKAASN